MGPNWVIILAWMFAAVQLFGTTMVRPLNTTSPTKAYNTISLRAAHAMPLCTSFYLSAARKQAVASVSSLRPACHVCSALKGHTLRHQWFRLGCTPTGKACAQHLQALTVLVHTQVYCQPLFESYDCQFGNILAPVWCFRNTMVRLVCRTLFIVVACFIACLLPFFGDIM